MILNTPPMYAPIAAPARSVDTPKLRNVISIPHRGVFQGGAAPENSIDSLLLASRMGFDYIECDLNKTSDGVWVLLHDATINRTFRNKADYSVIADPVYVQNTTITDLEDNYVYVSPNESMRKPISRLKDYLEICRKLGIIPLVEIKSGWGWSKSDIEGLMEIASEIVGKDNIYWQCSNWDVLRWIREIDKDALLYLLHNAPSVSRLNEAVALKPCVYFVSYDNVTKEVVDAYQKAGIRTDTWTCPPNYYNKMLDIGISGICSNQPAPPLDLSTATDDIRDVENVVTTGTIQNGSITLNIGETITFNPAAVPLGAYYIDFMLNSGSVGITATYHGEVIHENGIYRTASILVEQSADLVITAKEDNTKIDYVRFIQCEY